MSKSSLSSEHRTRLNHSLTEVTDDRYYNYIPLPFSHKALSDNNVLWHQCWHAIHNHTLGHLNVAIVLVQCK